MNYKLNFSYKTGKEIKTTEISNDDVSFDLRQTENGLTLSVIPKKEISDISFYLERGYEYPQDSKFFANGFQSWTDTKEFAKNELMADEGIVGKGLFGKSPFGMNLVGNYTFVEQSKECGVFHSNSFAYVRNEKNIDFFGSLNDRTGYTIIYADMNKNTLRFSKDVEGITISEPYELLDLYFDNGGYDEVFDRYFAKMNVKPLTDKKIKGYTSWYNYYQKINEKIILRDLDAISEKTDKVNTFQIDDGYQTAVGDWLSINKTKFPNGMKPIVEKIHAKGWQAGLWLAPFGAQKGSKLASEHSDWLVKGKNGKPIMVGANWGGFYAIDIDNTDARAYIKNVFDTVLNDWGFDLVKLDFLYATAVVPLHNKTRGQLAYESIDFLRECVGNKQILGCGVQQMPCFGKVEYMRIGADMDLGWKHKFFRNLTHREDVSTPNAIHNSVYRRCLNNRAFLCDPDVFLLRRSNIKFNFEQQKVLAKFIKLFGSVLFMSDNVDEYDDEQMAVFNDTLADDDMQIVAINETNNKLFIDYTQNGEPHTLGFCVTDGSIYSSDC
ncbi:glycoside hydrolase family 36 protein [Eubacterium coprostanoligenes]|uniref:glycoside hydrolase family 36 protein n=1 Tax=Eubacterium coprostanoligenes TaxID=290054 RepID=UPI0023542215|nr:alpha-galactosidase [Eubacterium coprostanoligenes]MCI6253517.1 alpha-galactosidase [Eubacterium coprostanoligenes]MDY5400118.1 alpha-galactosidase [Eubacterium coprostanoligenes]